jgi:fatty acid amide hydrolase
MGLIFSALRRSELKTRASQRRRERDDAHDKFDLAALPAVPAELEARIVDARGLAELLGMLESRAVTSEQVVSVYIRRAHTMGFALNALTHEVYAEAMQAARESDARRARGEAPRLLEGVPCTVKDMFKLAGTDATCGLATKAFKVDATDGVYVRLLREAGAIPIAKTNIPQCLMVPETDSALWGRCANPWNAGRTCGGSSGGEGSALGARCAAFGLGTDIGGSIRIPAAFCGIYGFKPTPERLTQAGLEAPRPGGTDGQNGILASSGPMGRCVDDLARVMRALLAPSLWEEDPTVPRVPFDDAAYTKTGKLRFGCYTSDGFFEPAPSCKRAVLETAAALREAGHEVVEFDPKANGVDTYRAALLYYAMLAADGKLSQFKSGLEGEALHPLYATLDVLASLPDTVVRPGIAGLLRLLGYKRMGDLLAIARARSTSEYWALVKERNALKRALLEAMKKLNVDLLLVPALGLPAFEHGGSKDLTVICSYTFVFNLFHMPAGVVPATRVREDEQVYQPPRDQDDAFAQVAKKAMRSAAGLPVAVQIVGKPFAEETVLRGMRAVESALQQGAGAGAAGGGMLGWCPEDVLATTVAAAKNGKGKGKK